MAGVQELGEVISCFAAFANASGKSLEDGKMGLTDIAYLMPALLKLPAAVEGFSAVGAELKDLDEVELEALKEQLKVELDLPQDSIEAAIEGAAEVAVRIVKLVSDLRKK